MHFWDRYTKPDEWQKRVRQPIHPRQTTTPLACVENQIHPNVQKLVETQAGDIVDPSLNHITVTPFSPIIVSNYRFGDNVSAELRLRAFANSEPDEALYALQRDDYVQLRLSWYY